MAFRHFVDRDGRAWEVRNRSQAEWDFEPVSGNPGPARRVPAPGYERDPYELSIEELQRLLDGAPPAPSRSKPSPFKE